MALSGRAEAIAHGKARRRDCPRAIHAEWSPPIGRPPALDLLERSQESRLEHLAPVRWGRMVASPFTFLRGSAMVMAWDVAHLPHGDVYVQACGDAHLCNFGVFATPERRLLFDLRDFDETLPAPWEWDVKRLAASIVVASRERGLSRARTEDAVHYCVRAYRETMRTSCDLTHVEVWYRHIEAEEIEEEAATAAARRYARRSFAKARRRTSQREVERLTERVDGELRIKHDRPLVFPVDDPALKDEASWVLREYVSSLTADRQELLARYHLVDLAYRVVGVGSVGTRCLVALLYGDGDDDPLFLQIKEAAPSVLEPFARPSRYEHQGERVVQGQRLLQAASDVFLGWKSRAGHEFYVRQLKDMKGTVDVEDMTPRTLVEFAGLCGRTLAHAHARTGDFRQIAGYLGKSDRFDVAMVDFASAYADQVERDHAELVSAVRAGRLPAELGA
jgi:uncharacterized protein (DUF2252 family)